MATIASIAIILVEAVVKLEGFKPLVAVIKTVVDVIKVRVDVKEEVII